MDIQTLDYIAERLSVINTPENQAELRILIDTLQMEIWDEIDRISARQFKEYQEAA